jgi:hypothetical protein
MRSTNALVAVLAIAGTSAGIIPADNVQNPTFIADIASKMHQKYFTKEQVYRFNVMSESMSAAAQAVVSFNNSNFTIATGKHQLHAIGLRDVASADAIAATAVTDPDDWRYFHYEGIRTGNNHWWRGGGSRVYEIKAAHDQVVTPTLPEGIKIPKPFLPTSDTQVLALYPSNRPIRGGRKEEHI